MPAERRWARSARDAAPALLALALSPVVAAVAPDSERPLARMRGLIDMERQLGLFFEPTVHAWFCTRPPLLRALRLTYVAAHVPVALGVLAWTRRAHPQAFVRARDTFAATQALAAIGYVIAPTAPPRMIAGLGYDDRPGPGDHGLGRSIQSPYAAMPSAHTAFSVVAAGTVWALARSRPVRAAALLYPPAVVVEIIATGDHIWLDAIGGLVVAGLGFASARATERVRRCASVDTRRGRRDARL
ncbi:phosphatase PAP2 family protein [Candidatus Solirubrobacter pratensis]|uniref:phosphatase PAP2 family protein n=1 Tax=Candidatus Solirubrobacter pratensis TaxID=1298857 RepID=UPI0012DCF0A3|nr:phosphatase PAP2 family protein [Candidatus Solirubrobacter pratensis]